MATQKEALKRFRRGKREPKTPAVVPNAICAPSEHEGSDQNLEVDDDWDVRSVLGSSCSSTDWDFDFDF